MKTLFTLALLAMAFESFAQFRPRPRPYPPRNDYGRERLVGTAYVDNRTTEFVRIDSCNGRRDNRLESITLVVRNNDLDLRNVTANIDNFGRRRNIRLDLRATQGMYREGSKIRIDIPGAQCVDSIMIDGRSIDRYNRGGYDRYNRNSTTTVDIFADIL